MLVQFNTDKNIKGSERLTTPLIELIKDSLSRFTEHITRVEVHLSDEDGPKDGENDKRCLLEARLEGRSPIAVSSFGSTHEEAVQGALDKLKASLDTILGRLRNY
ncbi:MAG: HPF/RaiA family ribosome-associated protein [Chitinophagaceae bacterium]